MNTLRSLLFSFLLTAGTLCAVNEAMDQFRQEAEKITHGYATRVQELNGGYDLMDVDHGVIKYIRDHAQEIGKELTYLLDHSNPQQQLLFRYELDKMFKSIETYIDTVAWDTTQSLEALLKNQQTALLFMDIVSFFKASKQLLQQALPQEACPILSAGFEQLAFVESYLGELLPLLQKHYQSFEYPPLAMKIHKEDALKTLAAFQKSAHVALDQMKTKEQHACAHEIVRTVVAFLQDEPFFATITHNNECRNRGAFEEQKPFLMIPESIRMFLNACNAYGETLNRAIAANVDAETKELLGRNMISISIENDDACDFDDACCDDDEGYCEYDFNAEFKKRHTSK